MRNSFVLNSRARFNRVSEAAVIYERRDFDSCRQKVYHTIYGAYIIILGGWGIFMVSHMHTMNVTVRISFFFYKWFNFDNVEPHSHRKT